MVRGEQCEIAAGTVTRVAGLGAVLADSDAAGVAVPTPTMAVTVLTASTHAAASAVTRVPRVLTIRLRYTGIYRRIRRLRRGGR